MQSVVGLLNEVKGVKWDKSAFSKDVANSIRYNLGGRASTAGKLLRDECKGTINETKC